MLRGVVLWCLVVVATPTPCTTSTKLDPINQIRVGSDYRWISMKHGTNISACVSACCDDTNCQSFSFNNPQPDDNHDCLKGGVCCLLKSSVPPLSPAHYGPSVRTGYKPQPPWTGPPKPTKRQAEYLDMAFTQFMHFSVTTFGNIEHDCIKGKCLPPSIFNPTNLSTDQWVQTAKDMGAGEICLTAHHEGGFCLWPTKYSNYSVMSSPYKHDIVDMFVKSCAKYNIRPCFYIGPNANGYLTQVKKDTPKEFVKTQLAMTREVLTQYGPISRLWWDHYPGGCGGLAECPGGFPAAWVNFTDLVHQISPNTLMGTGPDVHHSGGGESGDGDYPVWNSANISASSDLGSGSGGFGPYGRRFLPREADATIQNPGDAWFWKHDHAYWKAKDIWDHYFTTVGRGEAFILNMPPDTTGQIPAKYAEEGKKFGDALRATFDNPVAQVSGVTLQCSTPLVLDIPAGKKFNLVATREDLVKGGQRIAKYGIDVMEGGKWTPVSVHGETVGSRIYDVIPTSSATKVRFQCMESILPTVLIRSFAVYVAQPPQ